MSNAIKIEINADKGATLISPNFFSVEETIPEDATISEVEIGIANGDYTVIDPSLYTYKGLVKVGYDQATLVTLDISISDKDFSHKDPESTTDNPLPNITGSYKVVTFKILPTETNKWHNKEYQLLFDIKRTEIADPTNVDIWVKGKINVQPVITE